MQVKDLLKNVNELTPIIFDFNGNKISVIKKQSHYQLARTIFQINNECNVVLKYSEFYKRINDEIKTIDCINNVILVKI